MSDKGGYTIISEPDEGEYGLAVVRQGKKLYICSVEYADDTDAVLVKDYIPIKKEELEKLISVLTFESAKLREQEV